MSWSWCHDFVNFWIELSKPPHWLIQSITKFFKLKPWKLNVSIPPDQYTTHPPHQLRCWFWHRPIVISAKNNETNSWHATSPTQEEQAFHFRALSRYTDSSTTCAYPSVKANTKRAPLTQQERKQSKARTGILVRFERRSVRTEKDPSRFCLRHWHKRLRVTKRGVLLPKRGRRNFTGLENKEGKAFKSPTEW